MCRQQVQSQLSPSQHPVSFCLSSDSLHCFRSEVSAFLQQEFMVVEAPTASAKPATNAEAFKEVEKMTNANMQAILFTTANICIFWVQGLGYRVQGLGYRVQGLGYRVQGSRL